MSIFSKFSQTVQARKNQSIYNKVKKSVSPITNKSDLPDIELAANFFIDEQQSLIEAMSLANEAAARTLNKQFHMNQLVASKLLAEDAFIEMATGEGKTLVFALTAAIISKRDKKSVTVVTSNDYLAERDYKSNKKFFDILNISSACITGNSSREERLSAYKAEVLYSTLRETAYDYLRDERCQNVDDLFLPIRDSLLVDEADNVLVDNAAYPYSISETIDANEPLIVAAHDFAVQSKVSSEENAESYELEDDGSSITLSQKGIEAVENFLVKHNFISKESDLYKPDNLYIIELFESAGIAIHLMKSGVDYVLEKNQVIVIDKNSGRPLNGVSLSKGLQQIIEHNQGIELSKETVPASKITTESIVHLFNTVGGMSGTIMSEEDELGLTYGRKCFFVPSNRPNIREDHADIFFLNAKEKTRHTLEKIAKSVQKGQPVLVATITESEAKGMHRALTAMGIESKLLISASLEEEAGVIAMAGAAGKVTISTGVSGRGTDIVLGGNLDHFIENKLIPEDKIEKAKQDQAFSREKAIEAGGLMVIGYGRQPTSKSDLQLKGRSGRQGDPGESIFISSLEDNILGEYGAKLKSFLSRFEFNEADALSHNSITKALDNAQRGFRERVIKARKVNASLSSQLEEQRRIIYQERISLLENKADTEKLKEFDEILFSYQVSIENLSRSIFLQGFANKNPMQELKKKSFLEYELFMDRYSKVN